MTDDLRALAGVLQRVSGIVVREPQLPSLRAALRRVDPTLDPQDVLHERDPLARGPLLDRLVDEMTVNETFFLRHPEELATIDWRALAARALASGRRTVRVWSAACSSGEEVYSLALLAAEALGTTSPPVDVLGTDIATSPLRDARRGSYNARSARLLSGARRRRWFRAVGERLEVGPELREVVRFERHNLVRDAIPPAGEAPFDLVVCRNVLIYFDDATAARVRSALRGALMPGGQLLLGTVDALTLRPPVEAAAPRAAARAERTERIERRARRPVLATVGAPSSAGRERSTTAHPRGAAHESPGAHAAFEDGMRALGEGDASAAVRALRRALYLDPSLAVAALQLGRAHEALGDVVGARRSYWRALRLAEETSDPAARLYDRVGAADVAAACRARLTVLPKG